MSAWIWRGIRGCAFVAVGLLATLYLEHHGWLGGMSRAVLDSLQRSVESTPSSLLAIVTISDDDYEEKFRNTSPLNPPDVMNLIKAVLSFSPRLVGVDLDTEDWTQPLPRELADSRLVWARLFKPDDSDPPKIAALKRVVGESERFPAAVCFGLTGMQADPDFVIREYQRGFAFGNENKALKSFPALIEERLTQPGCEPAASEVPGDERLLISFRGPEHEIRQITAGAVLDAYERKSHNEHDPAVQAMDNELGHRVVLIGGSYVLGRDTYPTPVGLMSGVQILAHAIVTERKRPVTEARSSLIWVDLALGLGLVGLGLWVPARLTWLLLIVTLLAVPLVSIWVSSLLFRSVAFFLDFAPVLTSVFLHSLFEHLNEYLKLVREHEGESLEEGVSIFVKITSLVKRRR